jgi:hypothetical protein
MRQRRLLQLDLKQLYVRWHSDKMVNFVHREHVQQTSTTAGNAFLNRRHA